MSGCRDVIEIGRRRLLSAAVAGAVSVSGCLSGGRSNTFPVLGWYPSWGRYDDEYLPEDVPFEKLDAMYYANLEPEPSGEVVFTSENDEPNLEEFRALKGTGEPAEHVDMGFAIGGWNSSEHFSDAAATRENRERFAASAIDVLRTYEFDGFEIDWEFPTGSGHEQNTEREEDVENVISLVEECRTQLDNAMEADDREYSLSYSAPAESSHIEPLDIETLSDALDWINVMASDLSGPGSETTAHNAPLYGSPSANEAVEAWEAGGMARSQMMIGHAFYGRGFAGVDPGPYNDGLDQPFEEYEATLDYEEVARRIDDSAWERHWDDRASAPYLYDEDERNWVSATDPEYVEAKTTYAREGGYRGVFCWELSFDSNEELLDTMNDAAEDA